MASIKKGILLIQLGTPEAPTTSSVRRYLKQFLSDRRVITLPAVLRYALLYLVILPLRSKRSAKAYQAIWTKKGSPLRFLMEGLTRKLQTKLSKTHQVTYAMRYGTPDIQNALNTLKHCEEITVLPLYPQYASSTTGSSTVAVFDVLKQNPVLPSLHFIKPFYAHEAFIKAQSLQIKPYLEKNFDHILLSYHGLPLSHIQDTGCKTVCKGACTKPLEKTAHCYRAQCFETSRQLAKMLELKPKQYTTAFQSRLGRATWIGPYTDHMLKTLASQGVKNLLVACPAFVTDCLETLEEIGIQAKADWRALGGKRLTLIPCLNAEEHWVDALQAILHVHPKQN